MKQKNIKIFIIGGALLLGLVMLFGFLVSNMKVTPLVANNDKVEIKNEETGTTMTFRKDGLVEYHDKNKSVSTFWDSDKINSLFEYLEESYSEGIDGYVISFSNGKSGGISSSDELINTIVDELGGNTGGSGSGGTIGEYLNTPTPQPTTAASTGGTSGGSTPPPGGSGPSWCVHWRLSYCADHLYKTPQPTAVSEFPPEVIIAKDCSEWTAQSGKKTVISNSSCFMYSPTPVPE